MKANYTIRLVDGGEDDISEVLHDLHEQCFVDTAPTPSFEYGAWWVASCEGRPVAFAGLTPSTYLSDAFYLKRAGVVHAHRGQGLQRRLIGVRERYARRVGARAVYTDTATFNVRSSNNLFKAGFELFRPHPLWNGESFLYWRKRFG